MVLFTIRPDLWGPFPVTWASVMRMDDLAAALSGRERDDYLDVTAL